MYYAKEIYIVSILNAQLHLCLSVRPSGAMTGEQRPLPDGGGLCIIEALLIVLWCFPHPPPIKDGNTHTYTHLAVSGVCPSAVKSMSGRKFSKCINPEKGVVLSALISNYLPVLVPLMPWN